MPIDDDIAVKRIAISGALIAATVAAVVALVIGVLAHWHAPLAGPRGLGAAITVPAPALESAPQPDLQAYRDAKRKLLDTSAWVDETHRVARIPIATAMTLMIERGLRAAPGPQEPTR